MKVTKHIQAPGNDPVDIPYYTGPDQVKALAALMSAAADGCDNPKFYTTLSVRIEF